MPAGAEGDVRVGSIYFVPRGHHHTVTKRTTVWFTGECSRRAIVSSVATGVPFLRALYPVRPP